MSAGSQAPSITLPDSNGETFSLAPGQNDLPIALFFYPKSGRSRSQLDSTRYTPNLSVTGSLGCTKEACRFRDAIAGVYFDQARSPLHVVVQKRTSGKAIRYRLSASVAIQSINRKSLSRRIS